MNGNEKRVQLIQHKTAYDLATFTLNKSLSTLLTLIEAGMETKPELYQECERKVTMLNGVLSSLTVWLVENTPQGSEQEHGE